ncbi:cutinase family protein [Cryobacterium melibiosiphilum]|uniref:Cutinase family protein n=1 Tax=Cryobacterium melibiosiphilum TaxID=995039 RepID=A0A3A5ML42_9MICO|nr:PKD domain-containing protein [Cryobacterium melibiosiphilum]RJT89745.1 cutinase family protein [Cryobacterium melibiosiphilum]
MAAVAVRRFLGFVLAGTVVASALVGGAATAAVATTGSSCAAVTVLAFRGSGETNVVPAVTSHAGADVVYPGSALVTNGWEGPTLQRLIGQLAPQADAASIPVVGVGAPDSTNPFGYPAVAVDPTDVLTLAASAQAGAVAAELIIKRTKATAAATGCAFAPRFIAVGYSQGALAARVLAQLNPTDVVGAVTIGDPAQKPDAAGNVGAGASGDGLLRWLAPYFGDRFDGVYGQDTATAALCHAGDPVCDFGWASIWRVATKAYENHAYFVSAADLAPAIQALQALAADTRLHPAPAVSPLNGPVARAAASVLAMEGAPTVVSAVGSQSADPQVTYDFDFGGGTVDTNQTGVALAPAGTAGDHTVSVTVTDHAGRSDTTVLPYTVAPGAAAVPKVVLATPSMMVTAPAPVAAGTALPLAVPGAPTDSELTVLLVPAASPSPWGAEPAFSAVLPAAWTTTGVPLPADLASGPYLLVVGAENGAWGFTPVVVFPASTDPETDPGTDPGTDLPTVGGSLDPVTPTTVPAVGEALSTVDGQADAVALARNAAGTRVTLSGTGFTLTFGGIDSAGAAIAMGANTVLEFHRGASISVSGDGFAPNSTVEVYLFSKATRVGTATTNAAGAFSGTFAVPASIATGLHTLQVVGFAPNGSTRVNDLGVRVINAPASVSTAASISTLPKAGVDLGGVLGGALLVLLTGLGLAVLQRRRGTAAA